MTILYRQPAIMLALLTLMLVLQSSALIAGSGDKLASDQPLRVVVAKVNGEPIFRDQLEKRIRESTRKVRGFGNTERDQVQITPASLEWALNEEIAAELFYQEGKKLAVPDAAKKIAEEEARIKASLTDEQRQEISDKDVEKYVKHRFYIHEYMAANDLINPQVPEEEVRAYYDRTKKGYVRKVPSVRVRHILTKIDKDMSTEKQELAHKKIEQARQQLLEGKDFVDVAKEYSEDGSASSGGELGYIEPGFMPPEFEKEAFSLKAGEISQIIKTKFGYHIVGVLEVRPKGSIPKYGTLKAFFTKYLSNELKVKKVPAHARKIREKADVEILLSPAAMESETAAASPQ